MKKKMLQRSLALGALMAFVITGSALAADRISNQDAIITDKNISLGLIYTSDALDHTIVVGNENTESVSINGSNLGVYVWGNYKYDTATNITIKGSTVDITNSSSSWAAVEADYGAGKIDITGNSINIENAAEGGLGIRVCNSTVGKTEGVISTVTIKGDSVNIKANAGSAITALSDGIVDIEGENVIIQGDNAILARGDADVAVNKNLAGTVKIDGNIDFNYDKETSGSKVDANVLLNLTGAESYWNGNAKVSWGTGEITPEEKAQVTGLDLILADGAQWNPTVIEDFNEGDSGVTSIAINQLTANEGIINVTDGAKARIGEMFGTGADVNVETLAAEQVEIATKSSDTKLRVNAGSDITDQLATGEASVDETAKIVAFGADSESTDYQFTSAESDVAGAMTLQVEDGQVVKGSVKEAVNSSNAGISNMGAIALMTWRQENNDMNKRLGELRDSAGEHGVWVRMTRGEGKYKSIKNQYNSYQIGYDEKLSVNKNWTVGAALTYTDGESSFAQGNGENTHKGLALYGSYLNDDGSFIDLIAKYSRLDHEFETIGGAGKGDYETNGYSLSAEYGKRFTKDNGLWIEPQVELTYGKVGSADYMTSKGVKVRQDGMDSLVGRLGFALGKDLAKDKGNVYLRASYLYDFDGESDMRFSKGGVSRTMEQDLGGGWWEVGVGANVNLSEASHLYFDVEKTYGGDVATPWQWNAGVRWSF